MQAFPINEDQNAGGLFVRVELMPDDRRRIN